MRILVIPEKVWFHKEVTDKFRAGLITHEERVEQLKAFNISAWENIELDCRYQDREAQELGIREPDSEDYRAFLEENEYWEQFNDWHRDRG